MRAALQMAVAAAAVKVLLMAGMVLVDGGVRLKKCVVSCYRDTEPAVCVYDEAPACIGTAECVESRDVICKPRSVPLPWE